MSERINRALRARADRLTAPPASRRLWAWVLFVLCLGGFLGLPGLATLYPEHVSKWPGVPDTSTIEARRPDPARSPEFVKQAQAQAYRLAELEGYAYPPPTAGALDEVWKSGPISAAHSPWARDCKVCHAVPFVRTRDVECLACHKLTHDHVDRTRFQEPENQRRCGSCHWEHVGRFGPAEQNLHAMSEDCAECHADIKRVAADTAVANVSDFAHAHPEFRVQLREQDELRRVRLAPGEILEESTGLKFSHAQHLRERGIRSPKGRVQLGCDDCHHVAADKVSFEPVRMARDCQGCHALKIEPTLSNREVPHGSVPRVLDSLREFYQFFTTRGYAPGDGKPLTPTLSFRRPGEPRTPRPVYATAAGDARHRAAASATELFEKTACVICHDVQRIPGPGVAGTPGADLPQWKIAPVAKDHIFFPKATFSHDAHMMTACTTCHAAKTAKHSGTVLMPGIAVCRDCHAGAESVADKVPSDCGLCHSFHWEGGVLERSWRSNLPAGMEMKQ